jgi:dimethylaniline monooxygenase (N-oxide forming)
MWKDIKLKKDEMHERYYASQRHTIQVDYVTFMDELAELVGCRPDFCK